MTDLHLEPSTRDAGDPAAELARQELAQYAALRTALPVSFSQPRADSWEDSDPYYYGR